ncbi:bifunctional phosphoribosyl-AMP cyclohydrolase/phosphoribosyl-ATP diphosphatase HisIE [Gemmatimonas groenlandica]|uniref:Histidine biosynthesis bifunctional protein HisIE n=1 Tax=Gemmatimonas groenlandica TaxID=2732249 RepID=A0A6M4IV61_9BACT|nr:bifunctional phosphoribosyl-AMP cyclohydrolase/phosphoribosyl-ATP diphosphatase HisIE [Gemmatimonas groenlandica]QJR36692.1 bifunctional phosphoribosyl-AMP cyclohydrolase/phosphoribosyl-ATP diphosphatase HisIE [Gemmatimonas groenlandica]
MSEPVRAVAFDLDQLDFTKSGGLVTVVTQDASTGAVLMVAHADREALEYSLRTGEMHYRSRSRGLWHKGGTSGNVQRVVSLTADCDADAVLARVAPAGPACHNGTTSCFREEALQADVFATLDATITTRMQTTDGTSTSYTQRLLGDRNLRLKKLGEEAVELATACVDGDIERATEETADLLYHALVALRAVGGSLDGVRAVLSSRAK